jgi:hypothetical protein
MSSKKFPLFYLHSAREAFATGIDRVASKFFLDAEQLVIFFNALATRG